MRVPVSWLSEFIELKKSPEEIAEILTLSGHEVEEIYDPYAKLGSLITVKVLEILQPEGLKEVVLCKVTDGKRDFYVFTTAKDQVKPGLILGLATSGSLTFTHQKIEPRELKGYPSEGMFLSPFEAGISEEKDRLLTFPEDTPIGVSIYQVLKVSEPVLDIAITPNRGDLLSILGIARELNLICGWPLKPLKFEETLRKGSPFPGKISLLDKEGCFRYTGRYFAGIKVGESPFFLRKRLFLCGLRPINNIVDITNYVLLEIGQPLHAFDWKKIAGKEIIIRRAKAQEKLLMLDGVERLFTEEDLVIADAEKALVLAGIMGGEDSGVTEETEEIFLESAWFNPKSIRLSGQKHRLTTESSYRFERKVDPEGVLTGLLRASELILKMVNPSEISEIIDLYPKPFIPPCIEITPQKIFHVLGFEIEPDIMEKTLKKLGEFANPKGLYQVKPHSYRQDLTIPEDLIEEIARLYGYDKIPTTYPQVELKVKTPDIFFTLEKKIKTLLTGFGLTEVITYSFINPETLKKLNLSSEDPRARYLELSNPIASHLSIMRTSLLPGLIEVAKFNASREVEDLSLFELGKVFFPDEALAQERVKLGILLKGYKRLLPWEGHRRPLDLFDLKGILEELFSALKIPMELKPFSVEPFLKKGQSFDLYLKGNKIGFAGAVKQFILEELDLKGPFWVAEIELSDIIEIYSELREKFEIRKPPKFPSTFRDLSCIMDKNIPVQEVLDYIKSLEWPYLEKVELFDLYEGPTIPENKKSITLRFWYRASEKTLLDEEVNALQGDLNKRILEKFKASPR
jgi:phenylalanyl-tRNA synthetase beta chain